MWLEPIHKSLHRPALILGGDRELTGYSCLAALLVALSGLSLLSVAVAIIFWLVALHWLRQWGQEDPLLCRVYFQCLKYRKLYLASGGARRA